MSIRYLSGINVDNNVLFVDDANNRVGIGTGSPSQLLHLNTASGAVYTRVQNNINSLYLGLESGGIAQVSSDVSSLKVMANTFTSFETAGSERMRITAAGNVGIGTTAPGAKLQVNGTIATNSSLSDVDAYRIIKPNGGAFSTSTPSLTGAIRITYPVGFTNTMHRVKVNIYEYTTNESFTIYFGGYNYAPDSLWYNEFAYIVNNPGTDRNFTVRFGYNGTKMVVYIGELASTWAYPQVFIEEVELGYGGQSSAWRDDAWAIGFEATAFQNVSKTVSNPQATNWARNGSSTYYSLGNVGIGTTSPSYTLDIATTSSPTVRITRNGATDLRLGASIVGTGALIGTYSNSPMSFLTNSAVQAVITEAGNVGIGTTSPAYKLTVDGDSSEGSIGIERTTVSANTVIGALNFTNNNGGTVYGRVRGGRNAAGDGYVSLGTGLGDNLYAIEGGNVGIGTTSPAYKLDVNVASNSDALRVQQAGASRFILNGDGVMTWGVSAANGVLTWDTNIAYIGGLTNNALGIWAGGSEKVRITTGGNVGIGTTSPAQKLQVIGNAWINRPSNKVDNNGATEFGSRVEFNNSFASNESGYMVFQYPSYNNFLIGGDYDGNIGGSIPNIQFGRSNGTVYMHIASSNGNVGIGTTSPTSKLFVLGSGTYNTSTSEILASDATIFSSEMSNDSYNSILQLVSVRQSLTTGSASNGFLGFSTIDDSNAQGVRDAGRIAIVNEVGSSRNSATALSFWTNSGGTNTTAATEKVRITSAGSVGIGTTAPNAKLNVNTNAMGVTVSDSSGISLTNGTAAAAGAQQMSPTLRWSGQGWATTPLASRNVSFISFLTPQQGTTNPSGILNFASSINGGAYSSVMSLTTGGALTITAGFSATSGTFTSTINNTISGLATTPTDGIVTVNGTAATAGVPVQISPRLRISGTAWNTGGTPASNTMNWTIDNLSTSGNPPTSALRFNFDRNGGGYSTLVSFISNGNVGIGTTSPTEKLHVVGNVLITGTLEVDTVNNGSGDFLTRTSGGIVTRRTAAEVRSDIQASQYFTVSSSSWIPASTSGWFRLASTSGSQRGSVRVILSFIGGNFAPQNYIIDVTKDWSTTASLRVDVRTAQSQYISGVRVIQDTVNTNVYHLEANFASSLNPYQFDLSFDNAYGFNSTWTMATTAPLVASTNGTVILSKDIFLSGNYSTDLINTGNINISGNTLSSINTNGNIILSPNGSGNVGINNTAPTARLDIVGDSAVFKVSSVTADTSLPTKRLAEFAGIYNSGANGHQMFISSTSGLGSWEINQTKTWGGIMTFGVSTNSTEITRHLAIDSSGNVGIGTTSPSTPLEIAHSNGNAFIVRTNDSTAANNAGFILANVASATQSSRRSVFVMDANGANGSGVDYTYFDVYGNGVTSIVNAKSDGILAFGTADTERMRITSAGNVGIGTTSPDSKLQVTSTGSNIFRMVRSQNNFGFEASATSSGGYGLYDYQASTYDIYLKAGSVGIGTTSPANKLVAVADATFNGENSYAIAAAASSDSAYKTIVGYDYANDVGVISAVRTGIGWKNLSILPVGNTNLGVGTISPTERLHVSGNIRVTGAYYDSSNSAGSSGQVLSSTGSGTAWVNQGEATATSLYDLLPSARTTYAWSVQLTAGTWADIFSSNTVLSNGTWMVQVYVDDWAVGGQQYQETYSGIMSWGSASSTNETGPEAISEIILHRSGHAANTGNFYLRTVERASSTLLLQGMSNQTYSAASTINFKFVKIF